jgi:hypothetical protein
VRHPSKRPCLLVAVLGTAAALVFGAFPEHGSAASRALAVPDRAHIAAPLPAHATKLLSARFLDDPPEGSWRLFTTGVTSVAVSSSYASPEETAVHWGDFLTQLVHGEELGGMTLYLGTPAEVSQLCGSYDALGCYAPGWTRIVAIGEDSDGVRPEAVVTHEYGHYIAAHRENPPWRALDWGTKRWASAMNVCARTRNHKVFPGAEDWAYPLNPGEGFAETYRFLNGQPTGAVGMDWPIVDKLFYPDAQALQAARRDVLAPWTQPTTVRLAGRLDATGHAKVTVSTPLDGDLRLAAEGARVGRSATAHRVVCGTRRTPVQLTGKPRSAFVLNVTRP